MEAVLKSESSNQGTRRVSLCAFKSNPAKGGTKSSLQDLGAMPLIPLSTIWNRYIED